MNFGRNINSRGAFLFFPKIKKILGSFVFVLSLLMFAASLIVLFFSTGAADEFLSRISGARKIVYLSNSNIKDSMPADKWVLARIDGNISDSAILERKYLPDLKFGFENLPAFYNYFVPVNDERWSISYTGEYIDGKLVETVDVALPDIEFDATAALIDISKLRIVSDNSSMSRLESTAQEMREGLIKNIVNRYNWQGFSPENFAIAKEQAKKTLKIYVKNRLLEQGVRLGDGAVFNFNWIPESPENSDEAGVNKD